jgi:hypothetical protein
MSDIKRATGARVALLALCLLVVAAAPAQARARARARARTIYINAELSQTYAAVRPAAEHWQSTASVSAYYRTTSQALSAGDGTLVLTPRATVGRFAASLAETLPAVSRTCTWRGAPGRGRVAQLQVGTPFAHALSIQWPAYPSMWVQSLSTSSTGRCMSIFTESPLQGDVTWALGAAGGTGGGNHFLFAAASRNAAVESGVFSASVVGMTMRSLLTTPDGESYAVTAQGFMVESALPYAGHRNVLAAPAVRAGGAPAAPLSTRALRQLALEVVPKRTPRGCVVGQKRRRHQRCP